MLKCILLTLLSLSFLSCGEEAAFIDIRTQDTDDLDGTNPQGETGEPGTPIGREDGGEKDPLPNGPGEEIGNNNPPNGPGNPGPGNPDIPGPGMPNQPEIPNIPTPPENPDPIDDIPDIDEDDRNALKKCLASWGDKSDLPNKNIPFKKIKASVIVGGQNATAVKDCSVTEHPVLTMIEVGVNVGSTVNYKLLNPGGHYCIKTNVNVGSELEIFTTPHARLVDSSIVDIQIGGGNNDPAAGVGVNVNSEVKVTPVNREQAAALCQ